MDTERPRTNRAQWQHLHPGIFGILAAILVPLLAIFWAAWGGSGYTALQLAVVTFFILMFVAVPYLVWSISGRAADSARASLRDWLDGDLQIAGGRIGAPEAAILVLAVPTAVVAGLGGIALIARLAARSAGAL